MLAVNHVLLATSITVAGSVILDRQFFLPFIVFVVVASLLPDIDHKGSEMSKLVPVINAALPHRGVTHSIFAVGLFGVLMLLLSEYYTYFSIVLLILGIAGLYFLEKVASKKLFTGGNPIMTFFSPKTTRFIVRLFTGVMSVFLFLATILIWNDLYRGEIIGLLTIGYGLHLLGDFVTKDGIPLIWPFSNKVGLKLFRTGSTVEGVIGFILVIINILAIIQFIDHFDVGQSEYWANYIQWVV